MMITGWQAVAKALKARFAREDGAVSVDWVVLTAAIVGLAAASAASINGAVSALSGDIGGEVSGKSVSSGD